MTDLPSSVPANEKEEERGDAMEVLEGPQEGQPDTSGHPMAAVIPDPDVQAGVPTYSANFSRYCILVLVLDQCYTLIIMYVYLPCSQSFLSCQKVSLLVAISLHDSHIIVYDVVKQDEEVTDLETLLRQEREREKARTQEDIDDEVG